MAEFKDINEIRCAAFKPKSKGNEVRVKTSSGVIVAESLVHDSFARFLLKLVPGVGVHAHLLLLRLHAPVKEESRVLQS